MKNFRVSLNRGGFTLIELLVSITLISIVTVTFLGFFSQSIKFSIKSEDKLTSVNIAEKVLNSVECDKSYTPTEVNGKKYYPEVVCSQTQREQQLGLKRVHVKIYTDKDYDPKSSPDSELYGYIELGEK